MTNCFECGSEIEEGLLASIEHHYNCSKIAEKIKQNLIETRPKQIVMYTGKEGMKRYKEIFGIND